MNRLFTSLVVPAALVAAVSIPASAAAPSMTPDQQLVAGLEQARSAARETLGGKPALRKVIAGVRSARMAAPRAVGALEIPTVRSGPPSGGAARPAPESSAPDRIDIRGA